MFQEGVKPGEETRMPMVPLSVPSLPPTMTSCSCIRISYFLRVIYPFSVHFAEFFLTGLASVVNSSGDGMFLVQLRTPSYSKYNFSCLNRDLTWREKTRGFFFCLQTSANKEQLRLEVPRFVSFINKRILKMLK